MTVDKGTRTCKSYKLKVIFDYNLIICILFSDIASSYVAETFALAVFSPSRGTIVQLRSEENSILYHSRKSNSVPKNIFDTLKAPS